MFKELDSLILWFRQAAVPDSVWLQPAEFLRDARVHWEPNIANKLLDQDRWLRRVSEEAVRAMETVREQLGRHVRARDLARLQQDALAFPLPLSWLQRIQSACVEGADESVFKAARTLAAAMEAQRTSVALATLALNYLLRGDTKGEPWLALWEPRGLNRLDTPQLKAVSRVCRLLDFVSEWWGQSAGSADDGPRLASDIAEPASIVSGVVPAANEWLTLKQAAQWIGTDDSGKPLVSVSSLRKEFLAGRIRGMRARNSCNGRILLSRSGLNRWASEIAGSRQVALSPHEAGLANKSAL
ncbi:MAG: hypothetical protein IPK87_00955 [Planctomycetes bacterium]|nr:hypothetical protein [Planctomycetota bacterium]